MAQVQLDGHLNAHPLRGLRLVESSLAPIGFQQLKELMKE